MKATVDPDLCTGCELCVSTCPEVFEMNDDVAVEAADDCPSEAISIE